VEVVVGEERSAVVALADVFELATATFRVDNVALRGDRWSNMATEAVTKTVLKTVRIAS
jgi:hypothetical protein